MNETFTVRRAHGGTFELTRERLERTLDSIGPRGKSYVYHYLHVGAFNADDFEAACRHFGLEHLLVDISLTDIGNEMEARRANGAIPTDRPAPFGADWYDRETVDAMLDVYERRVAEAKAEAGRKESITVSR